MCAILSPRKVIHMSIGTRIKERRKALGYSAEDIAMRLGKSPATIYRYESGDIEKLPGELLAPLADILNTSPAYLMGWEETEPPAGPRQITDQELKFALWGDGDMDDHDLAAVRAYAAFLKQQKQRPD